MKSNEEIISEFIEYVNMTASELEAWLKSDDSRSAGWPKHNEEGEPETVGHESGRKIVEILEANPEKDPEKYTEEQIAHMRKVVSYCKRHLAQESSAHAKKSDDEVKQTKSYASLKNWGHDFLRAQGRDQPADETKVDEAETESGDGEKETEGKETKNQEAKEHDDDKGQAEGDKTGEKRKKEDGLDEEEGASKKRQTRQGEGRDHKEINKEGDTEARSKNGPSKGDIVSWKWGQGHPEGKVLDVKEEKATITTKKGNKVSRNGNPEDPAVVIETHGSKAVKLSHEIDG
ncbi:DNA-binding protein [Sodiomyces alkalinus F11]|uniref:DNA-binding protein n=1 Tax=Sodiomyces alkalinus (strain CBS 110278 / VKM F-3762 / F11) TaxID=1314773 RepID=A0A3N2PWU7_SODAK|nr:DNA-binding protein [Sodiomyces alkalinus F11]ROT38964.1 DNA-binding protein [Sodiomyces alkalinus F11]